jgi:Flp pilus assembly protein TadB
VTNASRSARRQLVERARQELPRPGDPRLLIEDFLEQNLSGPELLEVLSRTSLAWTQLRDMGLERSWQGGFGWFLARNLMIFGALALLFALSMGVPPLPLESALVGAAAYYVLVMILMPLRIRRHVRRREGILRAYQEDLGDYLKTLESPTP